MERGGEAAFLIGEISAARMRKLIYVGEQVKEMTSGWSRELADFRIGEWMTADFNGGWRNWMKLSPF